MFNYRCSEDGALMNQSRNQDLQSVKDEETGKVTHTKSLGTWKCSKCGGKKVKREKK